MGKASHWDKPAFSNGTNIFWRYANILAGVLNPTYSNRNVLQKNPQIYKQLDIIFFQTAPTVTESYGAST